MCHSPVRLSMDTLPINSLIQLFITYNLLGGNEEVQEVLRGVELVLCDRGRCANLE